MTALCDFQRQTHAVLDRAAIGIGSEIGAVARELIQQVAIRAMDFDAVEACGLGVLRALAELLDDARNFGRVQRARCHHFLRTLRGEYFTVGRDRRRRHRQCAVVKVRMRNASDMPELQEDLAARAGHGAR